jgi:hypothetical protein
VKTAPTHPKSSNLNRRDGHAIMILRWKRPDRLSLQKYKGLPT